MLQVLFRNGVSPLTVSFSNHFKRSVSQHLDCKSLSYGKGCSPCQVDASMSYSDTTTSSCRAKLHPTPYPCFFSLTGFQESKDI